VLITGRAGFIGSYLVNRVIRDRYEVRIVDNLSSGRIENTKHHLSANSVELIIGDLKDSQTALRAVEGVDTVFHFAANPEVRVSITNPKVHFNENVAVTFNLLEATRKKRVKRTCIRIIGLCLWRTRKDPSRRKHANKVGIRLWGK
jgi:UDP-glucose 4-epimerase